MCGIAGCIVDQKLNLNTINKTLKLMTKRGPDYQSYKVFKFSNKFLYLFHSRLSIIDLSKRSNQPYTIGGYHLIFNGEIYNYIELKKKYLSDVNFKTNSDTEVLLQLFIRYKHNFEDKLEGMWSFVIYNENDKTLYVSRDRFGEKPFYYLINAKSFFFGSEIKFIKSLINFSLNKDFETIKRFLVYGYKSIYKKNKSFYKEINILKQSHSMMLDIDLNIKFNKFWNPSISENSMNLNENIEMAKHLIDKSLKLRLRSDVPVAFNLSGGIDSSSLVALASKSYSGELHTFSVIDDDPRYDESENIDLTVNRFNTNHTNINIKDYFNFDSLSNLIKNHDQPVSTINYFAHAILQSKISNSGFKVSISGTAADEIFAGYWDHHLFYLYDNFNSVNYDLSLSNWKKFILPNIENELLKDPRLFSNKGTNFRGHIYLKSNIYASFLSEPYSENLIDENFTSFGILKNRMMNELFHEITPICLQNEDLNSMYYSVENRSPFLDTDLVNFAFSIPNDFYIQNGFSKFILREAMKNSLEDNIRLDRKKRGFNASISSLFNNYDQINDLINSKSEIYEILNKSKIIKYIDKNNFYENSDKKFIFNFINCKLFLDNI